jgi:phosphoribosylformylglycinamidine (FGAM) synthase-like enzyme
VMADTLGTGRPGGDAAIVRVHDTDKALAITTDCTPRYCFADPIEGGKQAVAETWRNITAVGAKPLAITDCMNFGNPERPEIMGQFVGCIDGMRDACNALDYPVVSGNVSFYNETNGQGILPTPAIGGVGLIDHIDQICNLALKADGETIVVIGDTHGHLGMSIYLREVEHREDGTPPPVDLALERTNGDLVRGLIHDGTVTACHDIADGGLGVALAEMAMAGNRGAAIATPETDSPLFAWLFGEDQGRYVITTAKPEKVIKEAQRSGVNAQIIGKTGSEQLTVGDEIAISVSELRSLHEGWLPDFMAST